MILPGFQVAGIIELYAMSGSPVQFESSYKRGRRSTEERREKRGKRGFSTKQCKRPVPLCQTRKGPCLCRRQVELGVQVEAAMIERPGCDH